MSLPTAACSSLSAWYEIGEEERRWYALGLVYESSLEVIVEDSSKGQIYLSIVEQHLNIEFV